MCLIIASPDGKPVPSSQLDQIWSSNSDGFGIMFPASNERIAIRKTMKQGEVKRLLDQAEGKPYVAHWRFGTSGGISRRNCHPFDIVPTRLAMAHNGVFQGLNEYRPDRSDTWHFVQDYLRPYVASTEDLSQPIIKGTIETVAKGQRLAFLDGKGQITLFGEQLGYWDTANNLWYSNSYWKPYVSRVSRLPWWEDSDYEYATYYEWDGSKLVPTNKYNGESQDLYQRSPHPQDNPVQLVQCNWCSESVSLTYRVYFQAKPYRLCKQCSEYADGYYEDVADGLLSDDEQRLIEESLAHCPTDETQYPLVKASDHAPDCDCQPCVFGDSWRA